jgi:hypothetical protein
MPAPFHRHWGITMPFDINTDAGVLTVLAELQRREPIFHRPELGTTRADFERMTVEDFWEIGASGPRYSREYVLDVLEERQSSPGADRWETSDFRCQELAADVYLLTYTLRQEQRVTRRATIWQRMEGEWKIVFHQGTIVESP